MQVGLLSSLCNILETILGLCRIREDCIGVAGECGRCCRKGDCEAVMSYTSAARREYGLEPGHDLNACPIMGTLKRTKYWDNGK